MVCNHGAVEEPGAEATRGGGLVLGCQQEHPAHVLLPPSVCLVAAAARGGRRALRSLDMY